MLIGNCMGNVDINSWVYRRVIGWSPDSFIESCLDVSKIALLFVAVKCLQRIISTLNIYSWMSACHLKWYHDIVFWFTEAGKLLQLQHIHQYHYLLSFLSSTPGGYIYFITYEAPLWCADILIFSSCYWLNIFTLYSNFYSGLGSYHFTHHSKFSPSSFKSILQIPTGKKKSLLKHLFMIVYPNLGKKILHSQTLLCFQDFPHPFISLLYNFFTLAKCNLFSVFNQHMAILTSFLFPYVSPPTQTVPHVLHLNFWVV